MSTTPPQINTHRHYGSSVAVVLGRGDGGRAKVVKVSSSEPRPLGNRPADDPRPIVVRLPLFGAELVRVGSERLRPALGRVFPTLLAPVDGHIKHAVAATQWRENPIINTY